MIRLFKLKTVLCIAIICTSLVACSHKENAYFEGQYLYIGKEKYVEATGLYEETNTVICRTNDNYTIYEVDGDVGHIYVVARSFLDQRLYVKENYVKDKTVIEGVCFKQSSAKYIYDEAFIDIFEEMSECKDVVEIDDDKLMMYRNEGIDVYIKYDKDCVSEYCGSILCSDVGYMYYNHQEKCVTLISEEIQKKLVEYNVLQE